ncbi:MAG TPA: hypothetical protein VD993_05280 [Chitinophagaceae bacterium]|nr:hypothetical protein [Chitinophagaceae bacterium]
MIYQFWVIFLVLLVIFIFCDFKYGLLRDTSQAKPQPYSWGRVQLAWWTIIIFAAFAGIFWKTGDLPELHYSTIVLLGISAATTTTARMIDVSDQTNAAIRHQDLRASSFFLDIVSDQKGVSIHRFQAILFNAIFGIWFIAQVVGQMETCTGGTCINSIIPVIDNDNLMLLGLSAATYAALKTTENPARPVTQNVPDSSPNTTTTITNTTTVPPATTGLNQ